MHCRDHGDLDAVGHCDACNASWCVSCSKRGNVLRPVCKTCGRLLGRVEMGDGKRELVGRLFSRESLIMAAMFGVCSGLIEMFGIGLLIPRLIFSATLVGYYFNVIAHVGGGAPACPRPPTRSTTCR